MDGVSGVRIKFCVFCVVLREGRNSAGKYRETTHSIYNSRYLTFLSPRSTIILFGQPTTTKNSTNNDHSSIYEVPCRDSKPR